MNQHSFSKNLSPRLLKQYRGEMSRQLKLSIDRFFTNPRIGREIRDKLEREARQMYDAYDQILGVIFDGVTIPGRSYTYERPITLSDLRANLAASDREFGAILGMYTLFDSPTELGSADNIVRVSDVMKKDFEAAKQQLLNQLGRQHRR